MPASVNKGFCTSELIPGRSEDQSEETGGRVQEGLEDGESEGASLPRARLGEAYDVTTCTTRSESGSGLAAGADLARRLEGSLAEWEWVSSI